MQAHKNSLAGKLRQQSSHSKNKDLTICWELSDLDLHCQQNCQQVLPMLRNDTGMIVTFFFICILENKDFATLQFYRKSCYLEWAENVKSFKARKCMG